MLSPLTSARVNGYGRMGLGLALLVAPEAVTRVWVGDDAGRAAVQIPTRGLGARDVLLGFLTAHVASRPGVGPRTVAAVALVDVADFTATALARDRVPASGAAMVMGLAAGSAIQLGVAALGLRR